MTDHPDLDALEHDTHTQLGRHLNGARDEAQRHAPTPAATEQRAGRIMGRLRAARAAITETATRAAHAAVGLGARDASGEAPPPSGQTRTIPADGDIYNLTRNMDLRQDITFVITNSGMRIETRATQPSRPGQALDLVNQVHNRLWRITNTNIHRSYNTGRRWYAQLYGYDLRWFAQEDERVCPRCGPLHDTVIGSRERFQAEPDWDAFDGQPPLHYNCRCYTEVIRRGLFG